MSRDQGVAASGCRHLISASIGGSLTCIEPEAKLAMTHASDIVVHR